MGEDKPLTRWKHIAAHIGVSEATAKRYARMYGLPVQKVGQRIVRVTIGELDVWLRSMRKAYEKK